MKAFATAALLVLFLEVYLRFYESASLATLILFPLLVGWIAMMMSAWRKLKQRVDHLEESIARLEVTADDDRDDG